MKKMIILDRNKNTSSEFDKFLIGNNASYLKDDFEDKNIFEIDNNLSIDVIFGIILPLMNKGDNVIIVEYDNFGKIESCEKRVA